MQPGANTLRTSGRLQLVNTPNRSPIDTAQHKLWLRKQMHQWLVIGGKSIHLHICKISLVISQHAHCSSNCWATACLHEQPLARQWTLAQCTGKCVKYGHSQSGPLTGQPYHWAHPLHACTQLLQLTQCWFHTTQFFQPIYALASLTQLAPTKPGHTVYWAACLIYSSMVHLVWISTALLPLLMRNKSFNKALARWLEHEA